MTNFRRAKPPGGSTATALAESPGGFPRVGLSGLCQAVGCCRGGSLQRARCALRPHSQPPVIPHLIHPVLEGARKRGKWCREKDLSFSVHINAWFLIFNFFFSPSSGVVGARSVPGSSDQGANFAFPDGCV